MRPEAFYFSSCFPFEVEVKCQAVMALSTLRLSTCEVTWRIGISCTVLYKWKAEIIGNSTYQTMSKHKELSPEANSMR